jgi:hypothetical protein
MDCRDESLPGLTSAVFVYKSYFKMAASFSNFTVVEQQAVIQFLWSEGVKNLKFIAEC